MTRSWMLTALAALGLLTACGSAGNKENAILPPTTAVLQLASSGTSTQIHGIDVTVTLPAGVTVKSSSPPQADADAVFASGMADTNSIVFSVYTAPAGTTPAQVRILLANGNGFGPGTFGAMKCDIEQGVWPAPADFVIADFSASDGYGNAISGVSVGLTAEIR